ncbi:YidC/Oxa1 family membrane protein insertase [Candidatus Margulisiibacteriota bacterium]
MQFMSNIMLDILRFFYAIGGHNYGLAIIWLTVAVNLALYPLTLSSIKQMSAMQKIQPRMQELQKKHKDEPQKLQKETMDLYKSEGVNPLGGCLPVLLKIPFFLALFFALQSKEFLALLAEPGAGASFLWVTDLSKPEMLMIAGAKIPTFAILIGITTYLMQKTMPTAQTGQTQIMTMIMPFFIAFISIRFPVGVQLYWLVSNAMAGVQQYYIINGPGRTPKGREKT